MTLSQLVKPMQTTLSRHASEQDLETDANDALASTLRVMPRNKYLYHILSRSVTQCFILVNGEFFLDKKP